MESVYTHLPENEDIGFEGRSYSATEGLLDYAGRSVLYLLVDAADITFCDRSYASHMVSINVKGYVIDWKFATGDSGESLSRIEPVEDMRDKRAICDLLRAKHNVPTVAFL
jgi:hypothetical protein